MLRYLAVGTTSGSCGFPAGRNLIREEKDIYDHTRLLCIAWLLHRMIRNKTE